MEKLLAVKIQLFLKMLARWFSSSEKLHGWPNRIQGIISQSGSKNQ